MSANRLTTDQRNLQDLTQLVSSYIQASGIPGATANVRFVGGTTTGTPASGTFAVGDYVVTQDGHLLICITAGSPGSWVDAGAAGTSFGTPSFTLGTANAAGASTNTVRADATIAAFDTTAPVTQAFGDAAAAGSAGVAARRDHKHGMPSASASSNLNEIQAQILTNATSTGDAGGRADDFTGASLGGKWTVDAGTILVGNSTVGISTQTGATWKIHQSYTPSGAFRLEARVFMSSNDSTNNTFFLGCDTTTGGSHPIYVKWTHYAAGESIRMGAGGSEGATLTLPSAFVAGWAYLYFYRLDGTNIHGGISFDRARWMDTSETDTNTVSTIFLEGTAGNPAYTFCDFVDVVT